MEHEVLVQAYKVNYLQILQEDTLRCVKESHTPYEVNEPFQTGEGKRSKEEDRKRHRKSHDKRGRK